MITILHIIQDNKFNSVFKRFDADDRLVNKKVFILPTKDYHFSHIDNTDGINLLFGVKEIKQFFSSEMYDVVWFHSLSIEQCGLLRFIPHNKKIVWWAWGWELYDSFYGLKPLIDVEVYKTQTQKLVHREESYKGRIKELVKRVFLGGYYKKLREEALGRIDYFVPVLPTEHTLMTLNPSFRAKEFYYPEFKSKSSLTEPVMKDSKGGILLGNSATYSMNHVDIIETLKGLEVKNRLLVVPLNYGDNGCSDVVKKALVSFPIEVKAIENFLPKDEYWSLFDNCSYAIFGMMRQQAMANVYYCLKRGIKVFMYKDSIPYQFLKSIEVVVYAIEDMTAESLHIPVSIEDTLQNRNALDQMEKDRLLLYENGITTIESELKQV